jgi:hypothetical protein
MKSKYGSHLISILATAVFLALAAGSDDTSSSSSATPAPSVPDSPAVLNDAKALDEKYGIEATIRCASGADDYLRSIAKYDFKWDDIGFAEAKFDRFIPKVDSPGVYISVSHKAKLQNGFGAFSHITLLCNYDTQAKKVLGYSVTENGN